MTFKRMMNETISVGTKEFSKAFNLVVSVVKGRGLFIVLSLPLKFN
jgi:hypothetical protein